jgi:hypothetical protein
MNFTIGQKVTINNLPNNLDEGPGWDDMMSSFIGKELTIKHIEGNHIYCEETRYFSFLSKWLTPIEEKKYKNRCPICGRKGEQGFNLFHCSNQNCHNGRGYRSTI